MAKKRVSPEELQQIRKQNSDKLDYILSQGIEYLIQKSKEQYGDNWMTIFSGEKHPLHEDKRKAKEMAIRSGEYDFAGKGNRHKPILKLDINTGEVLERFQNIGEISEAMGLINSQPSSLLACCTGRYKDYKGFKWAFEENYMKDVDRTNQ